MRKKTLVGYHIALFLLSSPWAFAAEGEKGFPELEAYERTVEDLIRGARRFGGPGNFTPEEKEHLPIWKVSPVVEDGSLVPVTVELPHPMTTDHYIHRLAVIDEQSLIKLKYIARFTPLRGQARVTTHIRLAKDTRLQALVECSRHGKWLGESPPIQVGIGGCGAVAATPTRKLLDNILRGNFSPVTEAGRMMSVNLSIRHPMDPGLAVDAQGHISRRYPAFFVKWLKIFQGETLISEFQLTPGLSNNPVIGLILKVESAAPLRFEAVNNEGRVFHNTVSLETRL